MTDFRMPSLGADMDEGTVLEWRVAPGQAFAKGDVVVEVDTDKAAFEVEADHDGMIEQILVEPGATVPVGTVLARLAGAEPAGTTEPEPAATGSIAAEKAEGEPAEAPQPRPREAQAGRRPAARHRASPRARKRARELGVDIDSIDHGSGPHGIIEASDVEAAAGARPSRQDRLRRVIAAAMSRSKREIPHYYLAQDIDLQPALAWLETVNAGRPIGERLLPGVLLLKAVANAVATVPEVNGYWIDDALQLHDRINLGMAISLRGGGVIAPALHDVQDKSVDLLMGELADLVKRARSGRVRRREMTDGTLTVTSLGDRGTDVVSGIIFPPQVALVGFGTPRSRPWAVDGGLQVRTVMTATLAADHRASDGHRGALFLRAVADQLHEPEAL